MANRRPMCTFTWLPSPSENPPSERVCRSWAAAIVATKGRKGSWVDSVPQSPEYSDRCAVRACSAMPALVRPVPAILASTLISTEW